MSHASKTPRPTRMQDSLNYNISQKNLDLNYKILHVVRHPKQHIYLVILSGRGRPHSGMFKVLVQGSSISLVLVVCFATLLKSHFGMGVLL